MNKFIPFLIGLFLVLPLGVPNVLATITEVKTACNLFDCYTDLKTDFVIDNKYLTENKYDTKELPNTELIEHIGDIKDFKIKFIGKNNIRVYGKIAGASQNKWGLKLFDDTSFSGSTWWNSSYDRCINLTIDHTKIDNDLVDFPIMVKLNSSRINYTLTQDNGEDIRFINESCINAGIQLPHEIEKWNETGDSYNWVKVDKITSASDRVISMYYNNPGANDGQDTSGVWNDNIMFVSHMDGFSNIDDSTEQISSIRRFQYNGYPIEYPNGKISNAQEFKHWGGGDPGLGSMFTFTSSSINSLNRDFSTQAWLYFTDKSANPSVVSSGTSGFSMGLTGATNYVLFHTGLAIDDEVCAISTSVWNHIFMTVANDGTLKMYINGVNCTPTGSTSYTFSDASTNVTIGSDFSAYSITGYIDEVRISNTTRTPEWVKSEYESQIDNLITYGSEEIQPTTTTTTTTIPTYPDRYDYLDNIDYELWTYGAIVLMFAIIFFVYI